jgi:hypothetical protein
MISTCSIISMASGSATLWHQAGGLGGAGRRPALVSDAVDEQLPS